MLHNKFPKWLLVILFFVILWIPSVTMLTMPSVETSDVEKRKLAPFPKLKIKELFKIPAQFEAYFNDHFGLRRQLIRGFNYARVVGLGVTDSRWVIIGKDGWLFQNAPLHLEDMRNNRPYRPDQLRHWGKILSRKQSWLKERGIDYLFVFAPSKHLIYPEKLPSSVNKVSPRSRLDQLVDYLKQHTDVQFLDLRPVMNAAKDHLRPYHKTDTHWNDYGAYLGYRAIMEDLKTKLPDPVILALTSNDFTMTEQPGGDLANSLDLKNTLTEIEIVPKQPVVQCGKNVENKSMTIAERNDQEFATRCLNGKYRALFFRDSYALALMPYFSESFNYIFYHPASPAPMKGMQILAKREKPHVVIELRSSRWLMTPEG